VQCAELGHQEGGEGRRRRPCQRSELASADEGRVAVGRLDEGLGGAPLGDAAVAHALVAEVAVHLANVLVVLRVLRGSDFEVDAAEDVLGGGHGPRPRVHHQRRRDVPRRRPRPAQLLRRGRHRDHQRRRRRLHPWPRHCDHTHMVSIQCNATHDRH
jgi:hypothetical protein